LPQTETYAGLQRNFRLLISQVSKQLDHCAKLLADPNPDVIKSVNATEDYIDTQKSMIENECFTFIGRRSIPDGHVVDGVRAIHVITSNLERISDFTVNVARQMMHLSDHRLLQRFDTHSYLQSMQAGVRLIAEALFERDSGLALKICQLEDEIDQHYRSDLQTIIASLRSTRDVEDLVTVMFTLHYLERMGDALLNIGEAIMFAIMGEKLKISQYRALDQAVLATPGLGRSLDRMDVASIWGTRSGTRIGTLGPDEEIDPAASPGRVLFKEGNLDKLGQERESLERWRSVAPGVAPEIVEFRREGQDAALLLQYLHGTTLQDLIVNEEPAQVEPALERVIQTIEDVWEKTRVTEPVAPRFVTQLQNRIEDVYRLHPALRSSAVEIGALRVPGFEELLTAAHDLDQQLVAPFSVFVHGDFNIDNIIVNASHDAVHFVDVHRSRDFDFAQDVSVFLVSNFRRPVFVPKIRQQLERVALRFLDFGRSFAARHGDELFEARLALGLVRSFVTSTRFELSASFARNMQHRAVLLLRKLLATGPAGWRDFRVPDPVLIFA
jgi:phosphate uptake regulator